MKLCDDNGLFQIKLICHNHNEMRNLIVNVIQLSIVND